MSSMDRFGAAQKRRASRSPDHHGPQTKKSMPNMNPADPRIQCRAAPERNFSGHANGINGEAFHGNSRAGSDAPPVAHAPIAHMGGHVAPRAALNATKFSDLMMDSHTQAAKVAVCQIDLRHAEAARNKALKEWKANQPNFTEFQAIAEQKNTAKVRTEERFQAAEVELQQAKARQRKVTEDLSELFLKAIEVPPPPPPRLPPPPVVDLVARERCESLQSEVSKLRDSLKSLQDSISISRDETMSKVDSKIAKLPNKDFSDDIEAMARRATSLEQSLRELRSSAATSSDVQTVKSSIKSLDSRVEKAEIAARHTPQAAASVSTSGLIGDPNLAPIFQRLAQAEHNTQLMVDLLKEELTDDIKDANAATNEIVDEKIKELSEKFTEEIEKKLTGQGEVLVGWSEAIGRLQSNMQTCMKDHSGFHTSIQGLTAKVDGRSRRASNDAALPLVNGQTPGLLGFAPVAPANDVGIDRNAFENQPVNGADTSFNGAHLFHMKNDIDMLKERERLHTQQYNNLITDQVVDNMVDAMAKQYPDVKNAQAAMQSLRNDLNTLRGRTNNMQNELATLNNRVASTDTSSQNLALRVDNVEDNTATVQGEAAKLRTELSELATSVSQHEQAVELGKTHIEQFQTDLKATRTRLGNLDNAVGRLMRIQMDEGQHGVNGTG